VFCQQVIERTDIAWLPKGNAGQLWLYFEFLAVFLADAPDDCLS
jgi:hypothetical protein